MTYAVIILCLLPHTLFVSAMRARLTLDRIVADLQSSLFTRRLTRKQTTRCIPVSYTGSCNNFPSLADTTNSCGKGQIPFWRMPVCHKVYRVISNELSSTPRAAVVRRCAEKHTAPVLFTVKLIEVKVTRSALKLLRSATLRDFLWSCAKKWWRYDRWLAVIMYVRIEALTYLL